MKASEISVGNAVMYNGHIFAVTDISSAWPRVEDRYNNKPVVTIFDGGIFTVGMDEIQPIPITGEFLKKNGFQLDVVTTQLCKEEYYGRDMDGCNVTISGGSDTIGRDWSVHVDNEVCCAIGGADVEYVHQLQNLLNLLEIEWEVKV